MGLLAIVVAFTAQPFHEMRRDLASQTLVLTYHDVIPVRTASSLWFDCSAPELRQQLDWLTAKGAHFISVGDLYRHLTQGSRLPTHPVAITFADNYQGFFDRAYPILKARRIPVAMFVHTGFVGARVGRPKMTWAELVKLDREGLVTIGSQTVTHRSLAGLDTGTVSAELANSKRELERRLGHSIAFVAYPNGSFDRRTAAQARRAGYLMGFTERLTPAERSPSILEVSRYVHTKYRLGWNAMPRPQNP